MRTWTSVLMAGAVAAALLGPGAALAPGTPASAGPSSGQRLQKTLTFVYPSELGEDDLESAVAFDDLRSEGWQIQNPALSRNELAVTEVANGRAEIGSGSVDSVVAAIEKGAPLTMFWGYKANAWTVVARSDIKTIQDLTGKRLAIHSLSSFTNAMAHFLIDTYHIKPQMPIVPGSHTRELALMRGSIDATFLELPDQIDLLIREPAKFHVLWVAADAVPGLWATVLYAKKDWLAAHPAEAEAVLVQFLKVARRGRQDPGWLTQRAMKFFPHDDPATLGKIVRGLIHQSVWPTKNEWTPGAFHTTLAFFTKYRKLTVITPESGLAQFDLAARSYAAAGR